RTRGARRPALDRRGAGVPARRAARGAAQCPAASLHPAAGALPPRAAAAPLRSGHRLPLDPEERAARARERLPPSRVVRPPGSPRRASYAPPHGREGAWLLANARARLRDRRTSRYARNLALVRFLGVRAAPWSAPLRVDSDARRRMLEALGPGPAPVLIHPGS